MCTQTSGIAREINSTRSLAVASTQLLGLQKGKKKVSSSRNHHNRALFKSNSRQNANLFPGKKKQDKMVSEFEGLSLESLKEIPSQSKWFKPEDISYNK